MSTATEPMPIDTAAGARFAVLPVKQLVPHAKNVRVEVGDVSELAASIKAQGVLQPLVVAPAAKKKDRWVVIAGHRRLAGAKVARLTEVPCVVRDDLTEEADQLQAMLVENGHRVDLTPVEEGDAYRALTLDYGVPLKDLAARVGRSQQMVRGRITLATSPESVRTRVIAGQVPLEQAIALAEFEDDDVVRTSLESALGTPSWAWALQVAKDRRVAQRKLRTETKLAERNEWRLLTPQEWVATGGEAEFLEVLATDAMSAARDAVYAAHANEDGEVDQESEAAADEAAGEALTAFERDGHHTCPGHAGVVYEGESFTSVPHVEWVCLQARLHDNATGRQAPADSTEETQPDQAAERARAAEEARARQEQQAAALAAAAKVRRRHLGEHVRGTDDKAARRHLVAQVARTVDTRFGRQPVAWPIADVLGITFPPPRQAPENADYDARQRLREQDAADRRDVVTEALAGWGVLELVGLVSLSQLLDRDEELTSAEPWAWRRATGWLQQVAATGYEWSPVELEFLPEGVLADDAASEDVGS
ncbi:ParB/RepB/Spo0J family partition protein [Pseudokineococcus marinus]|uniref:ParB/RepB/Spo0J family partition protein n=1 Tax=Pseudokineococcus marinus TaxID=351215 RepID=A0A849BLZ8_9ACTN|nr:ParB/RepB/Spo0J family partition protein [Pseudokineococcus marinus]NNH21664.1 ParB/RepB/Spo0J family partition protein [Pseudokineococcus marinus]